LGNRLPLSRFISPSPSAGSIPTSAEESHQLYSVTAFATILNDVVAARSGRAFLDLHCFFAYKAAQEIDQRPFIVVRMMPFFPNVP
jgi:hypothetical protein